METPERWTTTRLGWLFEPVSDRGHQGALVLSVYRDFGVIPKDSRSDNFNRTPENLSNYQLVRVGDLVVNRMKAWQGSLGVSEFEGIVSPDYEVLRPTTSDFDVRFMHSLLRSRGLIDQYGLRSTGIRPAQWRLYWDEMKTVEVALPRRDEQRAIANYLDRETARIDTLIEEQQCLIEMLRERREAAVRHALLSGIDGSRTKDSGVELLGEVPDHWQMVPTRYLCTITTGSEDSGNATEGGEYPFYVRGREVLRSDNYSFDSEAVMTPGDGQGGTGKVFHYFDGKFEAHQRVYVFADFSGISGRYFYYFLSTFLRDVALAGSNTVTMESLRRPLLAGFKVAVPPPDEQHRIVAFLDEKTAKSDDLVAEAERFIDLSRERRAALITAAVTGQIDVREVA
ncbi:restriction endonuclease subunit S [Janibacter anophelis]|uniref:restriction endonuclease subunit S n=1 Tax=Janibacter anophelis TaxID=319054 RepID=UPI0012EEDD60|nr:restriction endonuclease subunit S [Janibacter anophelis]